MMNLSYDQIIEKIIEEKDLTKEDIESRIKTKLNQLSDLISKEGAAHIIANELNVKIMDDNLNRKLRISNLFPGISSVNITGKVVDVQGVREFKTLKREGKVASFTLGDETGTIRVVMWDNTHINEMENGNLDVGKIVKLSNIYVKDNNGFKEVHMGNRASLKLDIDENIGEVKFTNNREFVKKKINELKQGDNVQINGSVVQLFNPKFYNACKECNRKTTVIDDKEICEVHKDAGSEEASVVNIYLDDGTENIRVVLFRNLAENLIKNINELKDNPENFENVRNELLGNQFLFSGRVTKNEMFDRLEFVANDFEVLDPKELAKDLLEEVN